MYLVMLIALAIYAIVMYSAFRDFKRTVLVWVPCSLLFNAQVCVTYGGSGLALSVATNISLFLYYICFVRNKIAAKDMACEDFFFKPIIVLMFMSYALSLLFSSIPLSASLNRTVKLFLETYGIIILLFRCLNSYDDVKLFIKAFVIVAFLITIDAIIENFTNINIVGDFIYFNSPHDDSYLGRSYYVPSIFTGGGQLRFGLKRCFSFFSLHLQFGLACMLVYSLLYTALKNNIKPFSKLSNINNKNILIISLFLLVSGIIFSNSKGPMIGFCIMLLAFYKPSQIFNIKVMLPILIVIYLILTYIPDYLNNFVALLDEDVAAEGHGSTVNMRQRQFELCWRIFEMNPITGMGIGSAIYYSKNMVGFEDILGAESCWLKLLPDQGLFGAFVYLSMYVVLYKDGLRFMPRKLLFFFLLAIFVIDSAAGSPSKNMIWWMSIYLCIRRLHINKNIYYHYD